MNHNKYPNVYRLPHNTECFNMPDIEGDIFYSLPKSWNLRNQKVFTNSSATNEINSNVQSLLSDHQTNMGEMIFQAAHTEELDLYGTPCN